MGIRRRVDTLPVNRQIPALLQFSIRDPRVAFATDVHVETVDAHAGIGVGRNIRQRDGDAAGGDHFERRRIADVRRRPARVYSGGWTSTGRSPGAVADVEAALASDGRARCPDGWIRNAPPTEERGQDGAEWAGQRHDDARIDPRRTHGTLPRARGRACTLPFDPVARAIPRR